MPTLGQHKLYDFRKQSLPEVQEALSDLLKVKNDLRAKGVTGIEKIYAYTEAIYTVANRKESDDPLEIIDKEIINFLDIDVIRQFIDNPQDSENREGMSIQLAMVASATNSLKTGANPYTKDELKAILKGEGSFYNDLVFINTLRQIMTQGSDEEIAQMFLHSLPAITAPEDIQRLYFWDEAVMFCVLLQTIWTLFASLNPESQKFLLQNYFYISIVAGVPVCFWLQEFLSDNPDFEKLVIVFIRNLDENHESVPMSSSDENGKLLPDLLKEFISKVYGAEIAVLEQEKFIGSFYTGQANGEIYAFWLREALTVVLHIRRGDIIER